MRPSRKAVLLMAAGVPVSVALILIQPGLWYYGIAATFTVTVFLLLDAALAASPRALELGAHAPDTLYIGEDNELRLNIDLRSGPRNLPLAIACDVNELLAPVPRFDTAFGAQAGTEVTLPLTPRRRGTAEILRAWLRWPGN